MESDDIVKYIEQLDDEAKNIREECIKLAWTMRGGASYSDVMQMSVSERQMIAKLSKDNLEITQKTNLPYF